MAFMQLLLEDGMAFMQLLLEDGMIFMQLLLEDGMVFMQLLLDGEDEVYASAFQMRINVQGKAL